MYHLIEDKEFLGKMRRFCSGIINQLVQAINNDGELIVEAQLVGSGAKNLETQNNNEPVDLDYNLHIIDLKTLDLNRDAGKIKNYVMDMLNGVLEANGWDDCKDSTSAISTGQRYFTEGNQTPFSIDLAIVFENYDGSWYRLIHEKTGYIIYDCWYWNQGPNSEGLRKKVDWLKKNNHWAKVRQTYLDKKNFYLQRSDYNHPSFICYIEAVNEVYDAA